MKDFFFTLLLSLKMSLQKNITIFLLILIFFSLKINAQNNSYIFNFNSINYFAPADNQFNSINKTTYDETEIIIDFSTNKILLKTYYSDGAVNSTYEIIKISDINNNYKKSDFLVLTCRATNYSEVVFEVNLKNEFITRKIIHNGIIHKYFNR